MSTLRDDVIQCHSCKKSVAGYEHRTLFAFVQSERVLLGELAVLDCGCEIWDYDLDVDEVSPEQPIRMVDTLRKVTVLEFKDKGHNNLLWHGEDDDDDD
jgi:hypothetical protein